MPQLHQRGIDLLVEILDAAEHVDKLRPDELKTLLTEVADVLGDLLKRDVPRRQHDTDA